MRETCIISSVALNIYGGGAPGDAGLLYRNVIASRFSETVNIQT